jgi:16S rRNA (guanine966-N2)-methyltransferase
MMRITAGHYRGRILVSPEGHAVRPASDKVRQAVFSSLLSRIDLDDINVLDGFCGTGSYGLEALSRGADHVTFIDQDLELCRKNVAALGVQAQSRLIKCDMGALKKADSPVSLIFLDPPYRMGLVMPSLKQTAEKGWASPETLYVIECEKDLLLPFGESRFYGEVQIIYCRTPV